MCAEEVNEKKKNYEHRHQITYYNVQHAAILSFHYIFTSNICLYCLNIFLHYYFTMVSLIMACFFHAMQHISLHSHEIK